MTANLKTATQTDRPEVISGLILGLDTLVPLKDKRMVPAINLDNAATTPPFKEVVKEIQDQLLYYGSIGRGKGQKSEYSSKVYTNGYETVKAFVGADDHKYMAFYVNSTTDGMNKLASALIESPSDLVLTTRMEHHANDLPWRERAKTLHAEVDEQGRLMVEDLERILKEQGGKIKYVTVTAASNVTGYVNDVHYIAKLAHAYNALLIVDGAQIVAHRGFSMLGKTSQEDIDFLVFSAHKMYSPFGGGAVVGLANELKQHIPHFFGGGMVKSVYDESVSYTYPPDLYEAGSPNYPGVVGMLKAMEVLKRIGFDYIEAHEQKLLKQAFDGLKNIPNVILYGDSEHFTDRVGIIGFNIDGIDNGDVGDYLAGHSAIAVRHAAFCSHPYVRRLTGEPEPLRESDACYPPYGMLRVSFGIYNTEADVDVLLTTIRSLVEEHLSVVARTSPNTSVLYECELRLPSDRG